MATFNCKHIHPLNKTLSVYKPNQFPEPVSVVGLTSDYSIRDFLNTTNKYDNSQTVFNKLNYIVTS